MSKGDSHLYTGTSGEGRALIDEVIANGDKISTEKVVMIKRDPLGKCSCTVRKQATENKR